MPERDAATTFVSWADRMERGCKALWDAVNGEILTLERRRWAAEVLAAKVEPQEHGIALGSYEKR